MNASQQPDRDPAKYRRDNSSELSALVANTENQHKSGDFPVRLTLRGHRLEIDANVFNPALSNVGDLLATNMNIRQGEKVLDLGTGSGFQAIVAASNASFVVASDSQAEAFQCAKKNIVLNNLSHKIEPRLGDLFEALKQNERFDTILFNFPFVPWKPETAWQLANFDEGHKKLDRFLKEAPSFLTNSGRILMTWSDVGDTKYFRQLTTTLGYKLTTVAEREAKGITHYVFELRAN